MIIIDTDAMAGLNIFDADPMLRVEFRKQYRSGRRPANTPKLRAHTKVHIIRKGYALVKARFLGGNSFLRCFYAFVA